LLRASNALSPLDRAGSGLDGRDKHGHDGCVAGIHVLPTSIALAADWTAVTSVMRFVGSPRTPRLVTDWQLRRVAPL